MVHTLEFPHHVCTDRVSPIGEVSNVTTYCLTMLLRPCRCILWGGIAAALSSYASKALSGHSRDGQIGVLCNHAPKGLSSHF